LKKHFTSILEVQKVKVSWCLGFNR